MLPKKKRVPTRSFPSLQKTGAIFHTDHLSMRTIFAAESGRFSVVISKKVSSLAVMRNRSRRRVYAVLEKEVKGVQVPHTSVIYLKKDISSLTSSLLSTEIHTLLQKAKIVG
jgi:ribonuclease P protein component